MKICKDCTYHARVAVDFGDGRRGLGSVCAHPESRDPVTGDPIPCATARTNEAFCGLKAARYYQKKEEPSPEESSKVIQLK